MIIRSWLRISAWALASIALFIVVVGLLLGLVFDKEVKTIFIRELNQNLAVPVQVDEDDIHFSVLRNFPDASVTFNNLAIRESLVDSENDFVSIEHLSLRFSLMDLIRKRYTIRRIDLENGELTLKRQANGKVNYQFWKTSEDTTEQLLDIQLEELVLTRVHVQYINEKRGQWFDADVSKGTVQGSLDGKEFDAQLSLDLIPRQIKAGPNSFSTEEQISVQGNIQGNTETKTYSTSSLGLKYGGSSILAKGMFQGGRDSRIEMNLTGKDLQLAELLDMVSTFGVKLPGETPADGSSKGWSGRGKLTVDASITGPISKSKSPGIVANFQLPGGTLQNKRLGIDLEQLQCSGTYQSTANGQLLLKDLFIRQAEGQLKGSLLVRDFKRPNLDIQVDGNIAAALLTPFLPAQISHSKGHLEFSDIRVKGNLNDLREGSAIPASSSGSIRFDKVSCNWKDRNWGIASGTINLIGDKMILDQLEIFGANSSVSLDGTLRNGLAAMLLPRGKAPLPYLEGKVEASRLDLGEILLALKSERTTAPSNGVKSKTVVLPRISGQLQTNIESFQYHDVRLSEIQSSWKLTPGYWRSEELKGNAMEGQVKVQVSLRQTPASGLLLDIEGRVDAVRIEECFRQFKDFGQTELTSRNLKGRVSGQIKHIQAQWDHNGKFLPGELLVYTDVEIKDGALLNYAPVEALSNFIDLDELRNIRFSTLTNSVEIINKKIHIPVMDVHSSALDLSLTGVHAFDGWLDFQIKVSLFSILGKKFSRNHGKDVPFEEADKSGGLSIYVSMVGRPDDLTMEYNKKDVRQTFRQAGDREGLFRPGDPIRPTEWNNVGEEPEFIDWEEEP